MILKLQLLKGILKSYMFALFNGDGIDKYASNPPISPQHTALCFRTTSRTPTRRQGVNLQSAADDCDRRGNKKPKSAAPGRASGFPLRVEDEEVGIPLFFFWCF